jgi:hypothetical protein
MDASNRKYSHSKDERDDSRANTLPTDHDTDLESVWSNLSKSMAHLRTVWVILV